ncbi:MAG: hypothetical protein ACYCU5_00200 [Actinomycetes bacterium]
MQTSSYRSRLDSPYGQNQVWLEPFLAAADLLTLAQALGHTGEPASLLLPNLLDPRLTGTQRPTLVAQA